MLYSYFDPHYDYEERKKSFLTYKVEDALQYGNFFMNEYVGYMNYKPTYPMARDEVETLMRRIQDYTMASQDLKLYLDVHPNSEEYFNLFKDYSKKTNDLVREYENKYYPIFAGNSSFINGYFSWITSPSILY